ncbi:MAG TPA: aminotransferase class III-fold pyridoxal phosphate-dependent enzyme [Thermoanaerobaculia bacterium]|nr:aminotransferase class III-fold pyridoxal phosphate-dependent enzyme [Thermoanaerobaculia bacterium]
MLDLTVPPASAAAEEARWLLPVYAQLPIEPVRGEGVRLETRDGRTLLDFYGGHAVALLGYRHPRLLETLSAQAEELFFQSNVVPLEIRARAARRLVEFAPEGLTRAFLVNSGAEANENALRLALRRTQRKRVIALEGSFHGRTAAAAAVTWGSAAWAGFPSNPFEVEFVPVGDPAALERALNAAGGAAALILEPVQGMAGAVDLGAEYLAAARALTRVAGALLIFDEVQCGMGRTGAPFAAQLHGVTPDLLTTAKGLAGGFPAGAVLATDDAAAGLKKGDLGTTFGGGPLACALIEATIRAIEEEDLLANVRRLSARMRTECLLGPTGPVIAVQGAGFLLGLRTARPAKEIQTELLAGGILTGTSADPHVVRLLPPLVLEDAHVDALIAALREIPA